MPSLFGSTPLSNALDDFRGIAIRGDKAFTDHLSTAAEGPAFVFANSRGLTPQQAIDAMHAAAQTRGKTFQQVYQLWLASAAYLNAVQPGCVPTSPLPAGWTLTFNTDGSGTVTQLVPTAIVLTPASDTLQHGAAVQFAAVVNDQNGTPVVPQPALTWTAASGTVDQSGNYTAPAAAGSDTVTVTAGSLTATAAITVQ